MSLSPRHALAVWQPLVSDRMQGQGTIQWPSGESYTGAFENDVPQGQGEMVWPGPSTGSRSGCGIATGGAGRIG